MSLFRPNLNDFLSEFREMILETYKEFKDVDESDRKSTVFSGNPRIFWKNSENFDRVLRVFYVPIKFLYLVLTGYPLRSTCGRSPGL